MHQDEYDTVLMAVGRKALTEELKVKNAGVEVRPENAKIVANNEQTNVPNVYAVGDVLHVSLWIVWVITYLNITNLIYCLIICSF